MLKKISKLIILCTVGFGFMWFIEGEDAQAASTIVSGEATFNTSKGNFSYKEEQDSLGVKSITITGHDDTIADVEIPEFINGLPVTKIGRLAFNNAIRLKSIDIPDRVESIDEFAFYYAINLTSIDIPDSVESIGAYAFYNAISLKSIDIPDSVDSIGAYAFAYTNNLTSVKISGTSKLKSIGDYVFYNAISLTSIDIPDSVESIGISAFLNANNLTSVKISDTSKLKSIGESAFYNTFQLTSIDIPDSVESIGKSAFENANKLASVKISGTSKLESIGESAFYNAYQLKSITLPDSVRSIGESAFYKTINLTSIVLPNSVETIRENTFVASGLKEILISNSAAVIDSNAFTDMKGVTVYGHTSSSADKYVSKRPSSDNWKFVAIGSSSTSSVTITFIKNDNSASGAVPADIIIDKIQATYLTNSGKLNKEKEYVASWNTQADGTGETYYIGSPYLLKNDLTLYAQWKPKKIITWNAKNGASNKVDYSIPRKEITEPTNPTKANHDFEAWYKDEELKIRWDFGVDVVTSDMTLYAKWKEHPKVTFEWNNGISPTTVYNLPNQNVIAPVNPTKANHDFEAWYKDKALTIRWDFGVDVVTSDMTLYAKWDDYTKIEYISNGGSVVENSYVQLGATTVTEPTAPTKANHRFSGWYIDPALTTLWDFKTSVTSDMTLYAKWVYVPNVAPPAEILDLSNIGDSSTGIQGTVSPNSYIQIVLNGTELANGRADNEGRFNIEIPSLLAGTELKLIVTNRFGSKQTIFLKVVDKTAPKVTVKPFSDKDTKITGKTEPKAKVKIYINGKLVKTITADAKGNYSYTVPKKKAGTVIKVIATDQAGNETTKAFKVLDKTAPAKPTVKIPTTNTTKLTGKAEKGSMVYVYKNNRVIAKAKVNAKGKYSLKIKKQKFGTTLTLVVRDQAKNTSKKTNTKVKKA